MKKTLIALTIFVYSWSFSQMTMKKLNGTVINDGDTFVFNSTVDPASYLGYKIYNSSPDPINIKVKVLSITNSSGTDLQLCIGPICVNTIVAGSSYPNNFPVEIEGNGENGNFDHFMNNNSGTTSNTPVVYVLKFYQVDASNLEIGNSITINYRYESTLSANVFGLDAIGFKVKSTKIENTLEYNATDSGIMQIFDANGKMITNQKIEASEGSFDVSNFATGLYIINFTNTNNKTVNLKIIKQ